MLLWRAGLRINEALTVTEHDLDPRAGSVLVRHGKGGRRREVGMDPWGWEQLHRWLELRMAMPVGPLLCVIDGPTRGRPWASDAARAQLRRVAAKAGVRRRFAPHQLRHAHAVELAHEGVPLNVIQRQLGHTNLGEPGRTTERTYYTLTEKGRNAVAERLARPSAFIRIQNEPAARLNGADLAADPATVVHSLQAIRPVIDERLKWLDRADQIAATLPHRERYLRLNHRLSRRILAAFLDWLDEVERELG